jgi:hypothetical protein
VAKLMGKDGVPKQDRVIMAHTNGIHGLTGETDVKSSDFNTLNVLTNGGIDSYYGFKFLEIPDMTEGGLPLATNDRSNFAWQKMAVGMAVNMEPHFDIWWDGDKGAHKVTGYMSANSCLIDQKGIVEVTTYE